jgi:transposase
MIGAVRAPVQKGYVHADESLRKTAIEYRELHPDWPASTIADMLVAHHDTLLVVPNSGSVAKAQHHLTKKVQRWLRQHKATGSHLSARQVFSANVHRKKQEAQEEKMRIRRRRGASGMSLAERTFMCELLTANCEMKTSDLQYKLCNQFGSTWDISTIQHNRKRMGFNCKRTTPYNRAADPVLRNQYKLLWYARGFQPWQVVFMDETHKAGKDFFQRNGFARGGRRARVRMNGPITRQFSVLAAMVRLWHAFTQHALSIG